MSEQKTPTEPIRRMRARRHSLSLFIEKIPAIWKLLGAIIGLIGLGATGFAYAERFAVKTDVADLQRQISDLRREREQVSASRQVEIAFLQADVAALHVSVDQISDDVRVLLKHILENPPRRGR